MRSFDAVVAGTGGMGAAAACHLADRGARVLALDRFPVGHDRGSSHGHTRLIRLAYHEAPDYVPLLRRAYELWRELETRTARRLLVESGLVIAGHPAGSVVPGAVTAARTHGLEIASLEPREIVRRFPALSVPDGWQAVHEPRGGYLFVEECVRAHAEAAARHGADLRSGVTVRGWRTEGTGIVVDTDAGRFAAARLVLCPGPWAGGLVAIPGVSLTVLRKSLFWFEPPPSVRGDHAAGALPCFAFDAPAGFFYGFPRIDDRGVKVAEHTGGAPVVDPLAVGGGVDPADRARIDAWRAVHLPGVGADLRSSAACLYTMSPDGHFLLGLHPDHPQVAVAAGFSGHGFKFASVVGEVLADLALDGRTRHPIGFLRPERFAGG